jgi:hypothetical protein
MRTVTSTNVFRAAGACVKLSSQNCHRIVVRSHRKRTLFEPPDETSKQLQPDCIAAGDIRATQFLIGERERILPSRAVADADGFKRTVALPARLVIERVSCIVSPGVACQPERAGFGTIGVPFTHYLVTVTVRPRRKVLSN